MSATGYFTHRDCWKHEMGAGHPECPDRLDAIEDRLLITGLDHALQRREAAPAALSDIELAHGRMHVASLRGNRAVELSNRGAVHCSVDWTISGNALWNADLIRKLGFADFGMNAAEYSARVFFMHCNKVVFSEGQFFTARTMTRQSPKK
jgi:acetoin utilization deacetylase AcuC-like enzyme